ncbi:MAG: cell division protein ZapA [Lachnospiraceae bacterium]|nr:cell division protein ZapA [Lachnospiraceae bacterium]
MEDRNKDKKNKSSVVIDGQVYVIAGEGSDASIHKIASYVDNKITELKKSAGYSKLPKDYQQVLLSINLTEELFRRQEQVEVLTEENSDNQKELYRLKQDIVEKDMKIDAYSKLVAEYKDKLNELQRRIIELEVNHER